MGTSVEDWSVSTVGEEFDIQLGKMLDAGKNRGVAKPYLGNKAVQWGRIEVDDLPRMAMSREDCERFRLRRGDLLVCEGGEVGRAAIWDAPLGECYHQKALHRLRSKRGYEPSLLLAFLRYWTERNALDDYVTQTSIAHLTREKFGQVPLPVPSKPERVEIAAALRDVDESAAALERLMAKKRDLKQAAIQRLLTGEQRLPGYSDEWASVRLADVTTIDPENLSATSDPDYAFRYISLEDVHVGVLAGYTRQAFGTAPSRARRLVQRHDILVATVRPSLMSHLLFDEEGLDWVCSTGFAVVRCDRERVDPEFVLQQLFAPDIVRHIDTLVAGSNYPAISSGDVGALSIPLPPLDEQQALAAVLADMDAELAVLEQRLTKTCALKRAMMQELLTGRTRLVPADAG